MYSDELTSRKQIETFALVLSRRRMKTDPDGRLEVERMADWGEAAVAMGAPDFAIARSGIESDVVDALANIIHFCDRAGLDPVDLIARAQGAYLNDIEDLDDRPAERDESMYPEESHR